LVLSHIDCFVQCQVVGSQFTVQPRDTAAEPFLRDRSSSNTTWLGHIGLPPYQVAS